MGSFYRGSWGLSKLVADASMQLPGDLPVFGTQQTHAPFLPAIAGSSSVKRGECRTTLRQALSRLPGSLAATMKRLVASSQQLP